MPSFSGFPYLLLAEHNEQPHFIVFKAQLQTRLELLDALSHISLTLHTFSLSVFDSQSTGSACDSADQRGSRPVRGNIVSVADTVPSAYLQLVLNNRKPGEMSSPIIMPACFPLRLHIDFSR